MLQDNRLSRFRIAIPVGFGTTVFYSGILLLACNLRSRRHLTKPRCDSLEDVSENSSMKDDGERSQNEPPISLGIVFPFANIRGIRPPCQQSDAGAHPTCMQ